MANLKVVRWTHEGYDRLYVTDADNQPVGWMEIASGEFVPVEPGLDGVLREAIARFRADASLAAAVTPRGGPLAPGRASGRDLALNRPGEAVRAKATEEWQTAKARHPILASIARVLAVRTDERAWRLGAAGEERVGVELERLDAHGWRVLHSIPVGKGDSDIDHVLIGPSGVVTVNTKHHPGARVWISRYEIQVNGTPMPYLRNSRHEAAAAARRLTKAVGFPVEVTACLVIVTGPGAPRTTYRDEPDDVLVLEPGDIIPVFKGATRTLDAEAIDAVFNAARWESTWRQ